MVGGDLARSQAQAATYKRWSVLVVVVAVLRMAVSVVDVVHVVAVCHGLVSAVIAVGVIVWRGGHVQVAHVALVDVVLMRAVGVSVVQIVNVVVVLDGDVPAVRPMRMGV